MMLICKNCDSENPDGAIKCHHCQMEGQMVYISADKEQPVIVQLEQAPLACTNCGCEEPGDGDKCVECHFPLPQARKTNGQSVFPQPKPYSFKGFELS
ncbi:MAG: hypothetical protein AAFP02_17150 [Bacteroidota bacterium]